MGALAQASSRLIVGNWKMNGGLAAVTEARRIAEGVRGLRGLRVGLCPPATLLQQISAELASTAVLTGGQDCHGEPAGAFTGDLSAAMLAEAGARLVILGHSERRAHHGEGDDDVARKAKAAVAAGLEPIICLGESRAQYEAGKALEVVRRQFRRSVPAVLCGGPFAIAYEPVWAIGTGSSASVEHIATVHACIRLELTARFANLDDVPILYGGSVNAAFAADILSAKDVGGLLVGGASLTADRFLPITAAAAK